MNSYNHFFGNRVMLKAATLGHLKSNVYLCVILFYFNYISPPEKNLYHIA